MRPVEVTEEAIIAAGMKIMEEGRRVNGNALRLKIGAGTPARMYAVWVNHKHADESTNLVIEHHELPIEIEDAIKVSVEHFDEFSRKTAGQIYGIAARLAERRVIEIKTKADEEIEGYKTELQDANLVTEELDRATEELKSEQQSLRDQLGSLQQQLGRVIAENEQLHTKVASLSSELESGRLLTKKANDETAIVREQLKLAENERAVAVDKQSTNQAQLDQLTLAHNAVLDQSNERKTEIKVLETRLDGCETRNLELTQRVEEQRVELHRKDQIIKNAQKTLDLCEARALDLQTELSALKPQA